MPYRSPTRVRGAIVIIFALLLSALLLPNVSAQFRPPTNPGGGGAPRPTGPQMSPPNGVFGAGGNGGPGNIPGNGNFAGRPPTPNFPTTPQPFMPTIPTFERVWTCEKCGKEVGRGNYPPASCQHCGVRLINGIGGGDKPIGNGGNAPNGTMPPSAIMPPPPVIDPYVRTPEIPTYPPATYPPSPTYPQTTYYPSSTSAPTPSSTSSGPSVGRVLIVAAGIVTGVMLLIIAAIVGVIIVSSHAGKTTKRSARRRR